MKSESDANSLARALDAEMKRIAKIEDKPMQDLVTEVAAMLGLSERQIHNYRTGKWPIPSSHLPALCQRFNSTLLLDVLQTTIPVEISPTIDLDGAWALSKQLIQQTLDHSEVVQKALSGSEFTRGDLTNFSALTDSIIRDSRRLYAFVEAAYEARKEQRTA